MKKTILFGAFSFLSLYSFAQTKTEPLWDPPKAACDAYKSDKEASQNSSATKLTSEHTDESRETRGRDLIMPIICNPPTREVETSTEPK